MIVNISSVLTGKTRILPICYQADMREYDFYGVKTFPDPVSVKGTLDSSSGLIKLALQIKASCETLCSSCGKNISVPMNIEVSYLVASSVPDGADESGYILCSDGELELDDVVSEAISLEIDTRPLCKPDCKGVCFGCGVNLNFEQCRCTVNADPELTKLKDFFN